jgi:hypothetical protein
MIGWATIAGAKKMASRYEEQLQDPISPLAASHPIRSQPVNDVRYNKQIRVCTSPRVASSPRSSNQPEDEDASNNTNEWIVVGKKGSNECSVLLLFFSVVEDDNDNDDVATPTFMSLLLESGS